MAQIDNGKAVSVIKRKRPFGSLIVLGVLTGIGVAGAALGRGRREPDRRQRTPEEILRDARADAAREGREQAAREERERQAREAQDRATAQT